MKKIITTTQNINRELIDKIKKTKINYYYINNQKDFRKKIIQEIDKEDIVLDCGKAMRDEFKYIDCKLLETLDVNVYEDYPDIVFDLCSDDLDELRNRYDKIICLAILEHVYNPFKAVENLRKMLKKGGYIFGMVPYLYHYHAPQDLKYSGEESFVKIGDSNIFREFCTVNSGTEGGGYDTIIGNSSLFMTAVHIAHDCIVGNSVIMANQATLGGHVIIEDNAVIGGLSAIHQFCRIGELSMIGGMSAVENDVFPFALAIGNRAKITGLNLIGLKRANYKKSDIQSVNNFIRDIFSSNESIQTEMSKIKDNGNILIDKISKFISVKSSRGLCRYEKK